MPPMKNVLRPSSTCAPRAVTLPMPEALPSYVPRTACMPPIVADVTSTAL